MENKNFITSIHNKERVKMSEVESYKIIDKIAAMQLGSFEIPNLLEGFSYIEFSLIKGQKIVWEFEFEEDAIKTIEKIDTIFANKV